MDRLIFPYSPEELDREGVKANLAFLRDLEQRARRHPVMDHPFLIGAAEGRYGSDAVMLMLVQMSKHVRIFTGAICAVMARAPDIRSRFALFDNLYEEMGRGNLAQTHYLLYLRMLRSIGIDQQAVESMPTIPAMQALNDGVAKALDTTFTVGLAWLGIGGELAIPNNFPCMSKAAERIFGRERIDWGFFQRHGQLDQNHNDDANALLALHMAEDEQGLVEREAMRSLDLRRGVWDELGHLCDRDRFAFVREGERIVGLIIDGGMEASAPGAA